MDLLLSEADGSHDVELELEELGHGTAVEELLEDVDTAASDVDTAASEIGNEVAAEDGVPVAAEDGDAGAVQEGPRLGLEEDFDDVTGPQDDASENVTVLGDDEEEAV